MGAVTLMRTPAETALVQAFEAAKGKLPGDRSSREKAFSDFIEVGLPHRRVEAFKYTDLRAAMREAAPFADRPTANEAKAALAAPGALGSVEAIRIAIVNGHVLPEASNLDGLPEGVEVTTAAEAHVSGHALLGHLTPVPLAMENPLYRLNTAFLSDGVLIRVAAGTSVERPIHLRFVTTGASAVATATRTLVVVEEGASVTVLESQEGPDGPASQLNDVVEFVVGDRAKVSHVRFNGAGRDALVLSTLTARLGEASGFDSLSRFNAAFRASVGCTPREYRARHGAAG